jgi:HAD superfamily hydrolase (TIGR01490 family)
MTTTSPLRPAAFFDLDDTVLRIDTGTSWMKFLYRRGELSRVGLAKAAYWSALYKLAILDLEALATRLTLDLEGEPEADMIAKAAIWHAEHIAPEITPAARAAVARHRAAGDVIALLTGSTQYASEVVAHALGIEHTLCSRLEVADGRFTGRLVQMCFGRHKVRIAEQFAAAHAIDLARSTFYSDSYNDVPMLARVGTPVAVNPDVRLTRHARGAGWRVERWA